MLSKRSPKRLIKCELQAAKEELQVAKGQLEDMIALTISRSSPNPSYADIARTPCRECAQQRAHPLSWNTARSNFTDTLYLEPRGEKKASRMAVLPQNQSGSETLIGRLQPHQL